MSPGFKPTTSCLPGKCSTNWATGAGCRSSGRLCSEYLLKWWWASLRLNRNFEQNVIVAHWNFKSYCHKSISTSFVFSFIYFWLKFDLVSQWRLNIGWKWNTRFLGFDMKLWIGWTKFFHPHLFFFSRCQWNEMEVSITSYVNRLWFL